MFGLYATRAIRLHVSEIYRVFQKELYNFESL
jgi:hypothetical protein